jgi:hypothetical protein
MAQGRVVTENMVTFCPTTGCGQGMQPEHANYDARTGLEGIYCLRCGRRGMRARDGLQMLFAGQGEYVFSYGPSLTCLKVVLSVVAVNLFKVQGVMPVQLATFVAEWALVSGQVCGIVRLTGDLMLSNCYQYCRQEASRHSRVSLF